MFDRPFIIIAGCCISIVLLYAIELYMRYGF